MGRLSKTGRELLVDICRGLKTYTYKDVSRRLEERLNKDKRLRHISDHQIRWFLKINKQCIPTGRPPKDTPQRYAFAIEEE